MKYMKVTKKIVGPEKLFQRLIHAYKHYTAFMTAISSFCIGFNKN